MSRIKSLLRITFSLLAFPLPMLVKVCTNITSGYLVIAILTSPSTTPQQKRKLLQRLIGQYHLLADDKAGSLVADKCWEVADVYLKVMALVFRQSQN